MNSTNISTTLKDSTGNVSNPDASAVILSVVLPIVFVVCCVLCTVWSIERDTRPEKRDETTNKLSIKPIQLTTTTTKEVDTIVEVKSKE